MATLLAIVWEHLHDVMDRRDGVKVISKNDNSIIYTFNASSGVFRESPYWSSGNNWVVCESVEQFREVWKDEGLVRAFEGKIPMPAYYEIEEWINKGGLAHG